MLRTRLVQRYQRGASSAEYALLVTLIAVVIIGAVTLFGQSAAGLFRQACTSMPGRSSC